MDTSIAFGLRLEGGGGGGESGGGEGGGGGGEGGLAWRRVGYPSTTKEAAPVRRSGATRLGPSGLAPKPHHVAS